MSDPPRFTDAELQALAQAKILGVRAGTEHRYTSVWVVVVEDRVFVRTWNDKPGGWYRAFRAEPLGTIRLGREELAVRARPVRSARLRQAVTQAYAQKYPTKGSEQWVRGFAEPRREATTLELVPAGRRLSRARSSARCRSRGSP
ncbi:MAG TPA: nitroreductase/quinone reductase family protein [Gemmatimonadales bacterium]|nr:nitroreductase/quinone reductase family protein [Gemmatimonadales bacterium]